ncbi:MAG TPA: hypothetical protein DDZ80_30000 [Cyanobacteria bacterium UBA8803]|nr:hypothetical protein [Cyanobacteria bacterium UBA9273]HBL62470.1 hypothetical protein [Cyanobacteria bacterium UBA8803]
MASQIYAIAHIGKKKLFVGEASRVSSMWPPLLAQLNSGTYPNATLQAVWNREGGKRHFSFHLKQDLINDPDIVGMDVLDLLTDSL